MLTLEEGGEFGVDSSVTSAITDLFEGDFSEEEIV